MNLCDDLLEMTPKQGVANSDYGVNDIEGTLDRYFVENIRREEDRDIKLFYCGIYCAFISMLTDGASWDMINLLLASGALWDKEDFEYYGC